MTAIAQYGHIWCLSLGRDRLSYRKQPVPTALSFCEQLESSASVSSLPPADQQAVRQLQDTLFSQFQSTAKETTETKTATYETLMQCAQAGLCLRCYVSQPILRACQKIDSLFSGNKAFSYRDLLPFVLNDDGQKLVIVDERKAQLVVSDAQLRPSTFKLFSVEVLSTYRGRELDGMSLENWAFLRTKQQPELKRFLAEFGFRQFSDWTLLNRIQVNQKERLSAQDQRRIEAFHQVYRRDRRQQKKVTRCADPTPAQLAEMNDILKRSPAGCTTEGDLLAALKQIAKQLREFDIWQAREPLEVKDIDTGDYRLRTDLPAESVVEEEIEEQEFTEFLRQRADGALNDAISQSLDTRLAKLKKSKRYHPFATAYVPGLLHYYQAGISLKEIGQQLGMNNWDQTRRILNPGELLSQVRLQTQQQLLTLVLEKAQARGLVASPPEPSQLKSLIEGIESFLDDRYFAAAATELKAGKNRSLESDYAQRLLCKLKDKS